MPEKLTNRDAGFQSASLGRRRSTDASDKMPAQRAPCRAGRTTSRFFSRSRRFALILRNLGRLMTSPTIALCGISPIKTIYANLFDRIHDQPCGAF
jgi:hypothetical protein